MIDLWCRFHGSCWMKNKLCVRCVRDRCARWRPPSPSPPPPPLPTEGSEGLDGLGLARQTCQAAERNGRPHSEGGAKGGGTKGRRRNEGQGSQGRGATRPPGPAPPTQPCSAQASFVASAGGVAESQREELQLEARKGLGGWDSGGLDAQVGFGVVRDEGWDWKGRGGGRTGRGGWEEGRGWGRGKGGGGEERGAGVVHAPFPPEPRSCRLFFSAVGPDFVPVVASCCQRSACLSATAT